jgi:hypothetical protein
MAAGVGGLDWEDVRPLIEKQLGAIAIPICVYESYRPGVAAKEPAAS